MKPGLQFRLHQQLTLTPQLQQAIRLLQLSQLELETELRQIAESNPLLEFAEDSEDSDESVDYEAAEAEYQSASTPDATVSDGGDEDNRDWTDNGSPAESPIDFSSSSAGASRNTGCGGEDFEPQNAAPETLQQHLLWQLNMAMFNPRQHPIATVLIDALNADGYLDEGLEAILAVLPVDMHATMEEIEEVRRHLQGFDPAGVASLDLRDCLRTQLLQFDPDTPQRDLALHIVEVELELLAETISATHPALHASDEDVTAAAALIRSLDPRPGAALDTTPVEYVAPDVFALRDGNRWRVSLNAASQPRLGLNQHYCSLIAKARGDDASWMKGQLQEARWLIKSLESRAETLIKVAEAIVRRQSAFLDYGPEAMHPLVLREVAEEVGMHESTISRVTTRKYMHTPRGTFELKYFFSSGVSTEDRRQRLGHGHPGHAAQADRRGKPAQAIVRPVAGRSSEKNRHPRGPTHGGQVSRRHAHPQFQRAPARQLNGMSVLRNCLT